MCLSGCVSSNSVYLCKSFELQWLLSCSWLTYMTCVCTHSSNLTLILPPSLIMSKNVQPPSLNLPNIVLDWINEFLVYCMGFQTVFPHVNLANSGFFLNAMFMCFTPSQRPLATSKSLSSHSKHPLLQQPPLFLMSIMASS